MSPGIDGFGRSFAEIRSIRTEVRTPFGVCQCHRFGMKDRGTPAFFHVGKDRDEGSENSDGSMSLRPAGFYRKEPSN
jgi:hypothetical protein